MKSHDVMRSRSKHASMALAVGILALLSLVSLMAFAPAALGDPGKPGVSRASAAGMSSGSAKASDLKLESCTFETSGGRYAADCGTLTVPENSQKAGSRLITLPVTRIGATDPTGTAGAPGTTDGQAVASEPIFWLQGGPGASNMHFKPPAALFEKHDFVMVGYRGADGSSVLDCPEYVTALRTSNPLSAQSLGRASQAMGRCALRLKSEGVDLDGYMMLDVVNDMEAARTALGYERLNLLSESYGTRVAQIYAYLYPDRIHRSIMVGVNPPGHFVWEPKTIDSQLQYYSSLCSKDPECSARTPNLAETVRSVAHNMPRQWLLVPIDPDKVKVVTFVLLFNRSTAAQVFDAYIAAQTGDPSGLAAMSLAYDFTVPSAFKWGDLAAKGYSADYDPSRNYITELDPPEAILGSPFSKLQWGSAPAGGWPTRRLPDKLRRVQHSDVETLLVSGSVDFSTPPQFATDELLPHLTHGKQVILREMGHTDDFWGEQPQAAERLLTSFYDTGVADDSLYAYAPMNFNPSTSMPTMAKLMLGAVLLVITALITGVWLIVRRVRRGRARAQAMRAEVGPVKQSVNPIA